MAAFLILGMGAMISNCWVCFVLWNENARLRKRMKTVRRAACQTRAEGLRMKKQAKENHVYSMHLIRVARDHEANAKAILKRARGER